MDQRIRRIHQRMVFVIAQAKLLVRQIPAKNTHTGFHVFDEFRKVKMQLQGSPESFARPLLRFCPDQQIQLVAIPGEKPGHHVAAQIAG